MAVFFCMAITEPKTTPVKKVINSKSSLSCRLCEVSVVANGGYYSLCSDNAKKMDICSRISVLFGVEENLLGRVFYARSVINTLKNTTLH